MGHIKLSEQTIYFAARGASGAPLVFVHGAGDSHLMWNGSLAAVADAVRGVALDLPGHGRSTGMGCTTIAGYADVVREFMDAVGLEQAVIAGCSMGGAIALCLALQAPERVQGLVLAGTGARLRVAPQFLQGMNSDFENTARRVVEHYYAGPGALTDKSLAQLLATGSDVAYGDLVACDAFDVRAQVASIACPTLIVCGRADRMTPLKYSEYLNEQIPNSELSVIENAGHLAMLEQPAEFNAVLRGWLVRAIV